jgi:hypothetical protein
MDIIDRYLDALRLLLPRDERDDIAAELRDELMSRREEREAELGRPLTRAENEAMLRAFGHPVTLAARYGHQHYLIGPELYPVYALVTKVVLAAVSVAALVTGIVLATVGPGDLHHAIGAPIEIVWNGGFASVGAVTIVFAILQRSGAGARALGNWSVDELPRAPRRRTPGAVDFVAAIVAQALFLLWWTSGLPFWQAEFQAAPHGLLVAQLAPVWRGLYLPVVAMALLVVAVNAARLVGVRGRAALALGLLPNVALALVAGVALRAERWVAVWGTGLAPGSLASAGRGFNTGFEVALIVAVVAALIRAGFDAWRILRPAPSAAERLEIRGG